MSVEKPFAEGAPLFASTPAAPPSSSSSSIASRPAVSARRVTTIAPHASDAWGAPVLDVSAPEARPFHLDGHAESSVPGRRLW